MTSNGSVRPPLRIFWSNPIPAQQQQCCQNRALTLEHSERLTRQVTEGIAAVDLLLIAMRRGDADARVIVAAEKIKGIWVDLSNAPSLRHDIISTLLEIDDEPRPH
ncbi:hypothetical protein E0H59_04420 [Rhizobium leguminosarum bv. viciae]|nr:hypothetical protein E0H59_04420 [Rhizobium leguminosarum bv. viciae]